MKPSNGRLWLAKTKKSMKMPENPTRRLVSVPFETELRVKRKVLS